ncbi:MAG: hypothetical protein DRJ69_02245 [Thermoprotei archaeon]|nr:MAG: hypothetical protein DRJ69_02245 [Thermoprotei archaeon]
MSLEEYVLELASKDLDPQERARESIQVARDLLEQAREELEKGDVRQVAEKAWSAAALAVKAYAWWREGKRLVSHGDLWTYKRRMEAEIGEWVYNTWAIAHSIYTCFYEGWCSREDVEKALKEVEKLVDEVESRIKLQSSGRQYGENKLKP